MALTFGAYWKYLNVLNFSEIIFIIIFKLIADQNVFNPIALRTAKTP